MKKIAVFDLHCDLLGTIDWSGYTLSFDSPETNCSLSQLEMGGVKLQVMVLSGVTGLANGPVISGRNQVRLYQEMKKITKLDCFFAVENASVLVDDSEPLEKGFERLKQYREVEDILYVSLTWNDENRFGGGNLTDVGLKEDGEALLEWMNEMGIAVDFSHTSDRLAYDIFSYIDRKGLTIPILASHSNFRAVKDHPRNLPDDLALEIIRRGGIIGINFVQRFIGSEPEKLIDHIEYGLSLGRHSLCLGADFYGALEVPDQLCPKRMMSPFFSTLSNASSYPILQEMLSKRLSSEDIEGLFWKNGTSFLRKINLRCQEQVSVYL